jgi:hypothetical protein
MLRMVHEGVMPSIIVEAELLALLVLKLEDI